MRRISTDGQRRKIAGGRPGKKKSAGRSRGCDVTSLSDWKRRQLADSGQIAVPCLSVANTRTPNSVNLSIAATNSQAPDATMPMPMSRAQKQATLLRFILSDGIQEADLEALLAATSSLPRREA